MFVPEESYKIKLIWSPRDMGNYKNPDNNDFINAHYSEGAFRVTFSLCPEKTAEECEGSWMIVAPLYLRKDLGARWGDRSVIYDRLIKFIKDYDCSEKAQFKDRMNGRKFNSLTIDETYVHSRFALLRKKFKRALQKYGYYSPSKAILSLFMLGCMLSFFEFNFALTVLISISILIVQIIDFRKDIESTKVMNNALVMTLTLGRPHNIKLDTVKSTIKRYRYRYSATLILAILLLIISTAQS